VPIDIYVRACIQQQGINLARSGSLNSIPKSELYLLSGRTF